MNASQRRARSYKELLAENVTQEANSLRSWATELRQAYETKDWAGVASVQISLEVTAMHLENLVKPED